MPAPPGQRREYSAADDAALRRWVAQHPGCSSQGHTLWQQAAAQNITPHSWQSMRERWRKKLKPRPLGAPAVAAAAPAAAAAAVQDASPQDVPSPQAQGQPLVASSAGGASSSKAARSNTAASPSAAAAAAARRVVSPAPQHARSTRSLSSLLLQAAGSGQLPLPASEGQAPVFLKRKRKAAESPGPAAPVEQRSRREGDEPLQPLPELPQPGNAGVALALHSGATCRPEAVPTAGEERAAEEPEEHSAPNQVAFETVVREVDGTMGRSSALFVCEDDTPPQSQQPAETAPRSMVQSPSLNNNSGGEGSGGGGSVAAQREDDYQLHPWADAEEEPVPEDTLALMMDLGEDNGGQEDGAEAAGALQNDVRDGVVATDGADSRLEEQAQDGHMEVDAGLLPQSNAAQAAGGSQDRSNANSPASQANGCENQMLTQGNAADLPGSQASPQAAENASPLEVPAAQDFFPYSCGSPSSSIEDHVALPGDEEDDALMRRAEQDSDVLLDMLPQDPTSDAGPGPGPAAAGNTETAVMPAGGSSCVGNPRSAQAQQQPVGDGGAGCQRHL
eukprot:CAMPEP_0178392538 /NCGR_PEP_ID=MMETSP0689_2-20121128/11730_1 /TAXON_ID=160604 /ORGANISM="Amphidinium massartii, Strain CS-259" /LENGTH=561 /DNA_ID=CAMNT_0020013115 /DNA_START=20 /DNA_END=1701 /DNA_ORIENTATION=+